MHTAMLRNSSLKGYFLSHFKPQCLTLPLYLFLTDSELQAILAFPSRVGVTANLNLDYKAPTRADQVNITQTFDA